VLQIAKAQGFHTINLVRREEQVAEIRELGGDIVLCTADESWPEPPAARRYHLDDALEAFTAAERAGEDAKPLLAFAQG
jgi:NADPH:quinone reductase-like Zn-dependent oxidoreductase